MKVYEMRALRGPNYFHQKPVILMKINLEEWEEKPTDLVEGFRDRIEESIPSLVEHTCSPGVKGGFFLRVERGTWAGHVIEHVAIELQNLIGHKIAYGKTLTLEEKGHYTIAYRYLIEEVGLAAGEMAVEIVLEILKGKNVDIQPFVKELEEVCIQSQLGPSTQAIVEEANKRGIPHIRLNKYNYVQLGQGKYQQRIEATMTGRTSSIGVEIASDKERTKEILEENGIPVPIGRAVDTFKDALKVVEEISYPVVVKPLSGNHGRGITININNETELKKGLDLALKISPYAIVEKYLKGFDFRILVIDGKLVAAALREPAYVIGNGSDSVKNLIEKVNLDPNRGDGHDKILTRISINEETLRVLNLQDLSLEDIIPKGEKIYIKCTANLSSGGTAIDVTDRVHPFNKAMAERIAGLIGLDIMGIDIMAQSIEVPLEHGESGIVEVNAAPGFRMHLSPIKGQGRNVGKAVVDMLFPPGIQHSLPICAITGTNGKTTTTRLIAHIIKRSGKVVGMASTDAVEVDSIPLVKGDYSGPSAAEMVMKDSRVEHAVLEVARGGILRRGLGFSQCHVGVFLNVTADHLGLGGIQTLEDLARVKSTVVETVKEDGFAILNADDPLTYARMDKIKGRIIFISRDANKIILKENIQKGNLNVIQKKEKIYIQTKEELLEIIDVKEAPITFNGKATFNIENVLAAVAATYVSGIDVEIIRKGLMTFYSTKEQSPGRMNFFDVGGFKILVDYGHNPGSIAATGDFLRNLMPGRVIRMVEGVGDRREEDLLEFGRLLGKYSDLAIIADPSSRTRKLGETPKIVKKGLIEGGMKEENIEVLLKERQATKRVLSLGRPGDLLVLQVENIEQVTRDVLDFIENYKEDISIAFVEEVDKNVS